MMMCCLYFWHKTLVGKKNCDYMRSEYIADGGSEGKWKSEAGKAAVSPSLEMY